MLGNEKASLVLVQKGNDHRNDVVITDPLKLDLNAYPRTGSAPIPSPSSKLDFSGGEASAIRKTAPVDTLHDKTLVAVTGKM